MEVSNWLHNALIADRVAEAFEADDIEEARALIREHIKQKRDATRHLARQLGFGEWLVDDDTHATLDLLVSELQLLLNQGWPLADAAKASRDLAQLACRDLPDDEVYATLLAGPSRWLQARVEAGTVGELPQRMRPVLERCFTASIARMLAQWATWDIPKLYDQWMDALRMKVEQEEKAAQDVRQRRAEERRSEREDNIRQWGNRYTRPGRTT